MRLAYICSDAGIPVFGHKGASLHVQEMLRALRDHADEITLFARQTGGALPQDLEGIVIEKLADLPGGQGPLKELAALRANHTTAEQLRQAGPFDIVYERYALWSHLALAEARASGALTILEVNAPLVEEQRRFRHLYDVAAAQAATAKAFRAADLIVAVSQGVADYLSGFPEARGKVHVVANGVNTARFAEVAARPQPQSHAYTVGFVGTLKPWHGVEMLVEAFAKLLARVPDARLLIVGDGPQRESLAQLCATLGVEGQTEFTGSVAPGSMPAQLGRMHVGVAPYPPTDEFYFSPLKVYEYLAAGLPVVASDIGQIGDIVGDDAGLLCPPGDVDALSDALSTLEADPVARARMGAIGRARVLERHDWKAVARRILVLAGMVDGQRQPSESQR